jgi:hypothetical protein
MVHRAVTDDRSYVTRIMSLPAAGYINDLDILADIQIKKGI